MNLVVIESPFAADPEQVEDVVEIWNKDHRLLCMNSRGYILDDFREAVYMPVPNEPEHDRQVRVLAAAVLRLRNTWYARAAMLDSLERGEAPYAIHLLYTQVLDDTVPSEREAGMKAGRAWIGAAQLHAFYVDLGMSPGMQRAHQHSLSWGPGVTIRQLSEKSKDWIRDKIPGVLAPVFKPGKPIKPIEEQ